MMPNPTRPIGDTMPMLGIKLSAAADRLSIGGPPLHRPRLRPAVPEQRDPDALHNCGLELASSDVTSRAAAGRTQRPHLFSMAYWNLNWRY